MSKFKVSKLRKYTLLGGTALIIAATVFSLGVGTYCSICPVGFLEVTAASAAIPYGMLPGVIAGALLIYLFGRFFCSWLCTTILLRNLVGVKCSEADGCFLKGSPKIGLLPYAFLGVTVAVSFIVKFPVFCLICPIGLFMGIIYAVVRLFVVMEPSWNLIIFPAIIFVEVILFKKWCSYICPISGFFMLLSRIPGPKFRPYAERSTCFSQPGEPDNLCCKICPEGGRLLENPDELVGRCTNCMECRDSCPSGSIAMRFYDPKKGH